MRAYSKSCIQAAGFTALTVVLATGCVKLVEHESMAEYNAARSALGGSPNFVPQGGEWADAEPGLASVPRLPGHTAP